MIKISNIKSILTWNTDKNCLVNLKNKNIYIKNDKIVSISGKDLKVESEIDACNNIVTPGFIDCHTHPIFNNSRSNDFMLRTSGKSYQEINDSGGGINSSVKSLRKINESDLYERCLLRMDTFLFNGTTTIEAKSGYGLSLIDEIKSLNVIKKINQNHILDLVPTFLGAHSVPNEFKNNKKGYVNLICNEMIPEISKLGLAKFCDVFCEEKYFTYEDSLKILNTAKKYNLIPRLHADEFEDSRGLELACKVNAISADHLMAANESYFKEMSDKGVIAVILPGTTFFLGQKNYVNAKKLLENKCEVALASDFNPGSCTLNSLPQIMFLAMNYCNMSFEEVFKGVTINAAKAINKEKSIGLIKGGYQADILFWEIDEMYDIPYWFNSSNLSKIVKKGKLIIL